MSLRLRPTTKKHRFQNVQESPEAVLREANKLLKSLEDLRHEIILRDEAYQAAKSSGDKEQMEHYHQLARDISQKCLDYGRELCEKPIPSWVSANLSKENEVITKHSYEVIRNKICASLNVFDGDLLPNARALIDFAKGKI